MPDVDRRNPPGTFYRWLRDEKKSKYKGPKNPKSGQRKPRDLR